MSRTLFDIGANRGEVVTEALHQGFAKVVAVEAAPKMAALLAKNFSIDSRVIPLRMAASNVDNETVTFYEASQDGLSTLDINWLTSPESLYNGYGYTELQTSTITIDTLAEKYGEPELIKVDVEGAEGLVLEGMTTVTPIIDFEWSLPFIDEADRIVLDLASRLGYTHFSPQFIVPHLHETKETLYEIGSTTAAEWVRDRAGWWESEGWRENGAIRQFADAGMIWVYKTP